MWYSKKKEILEHLGLDGKNVRALDRLIRKGIVIENKGSYIYKNDLQARAIRKLQAEVKELKKSDQIKEALPWESEELQEAKAQWEYWEAKCREYGRKMNLMVEVVYDIIKPKLGNKLEPFSEFKEAIFEKVRELDEN